MGDPVGLVVATTPVLPGALVITHRRAHLRNDLRRRGRPVRPRDLDLINPAPGAERGPALVPRNTADYAGIHDLGLHA